MPGFATMLHGVRVDVVNHDAQASLDEDECI